MKKYLSIKNISLVVAVLLVSAGCNLLQNNGPLGVLKSYDGGSTWQSENAIANSKSGNIAGLSVSEMMFDPNSRSTIYIGSPNQGVWVSTDNATSWKQILSKVNVYDLYVDTANSAQNLYAAGIYSNHGRIIKSIDGGATWSEVYQEASANNSVNTITADSNDHNLYAGLNSGALIKSVDAGTTWYVAHDFKDQILKLRYDPGNNNLYALTRTNGLFASTDGGNNWKDLTTALTSQVLSDSIQITNKKVDTFSKMALDDTTPGVIYLSTSSGLYKTTNNGGNWTFITVPIKDTAQLPRAVASANSGTLVYISIGSTIFKSSDGGQSWQTQTLPTANQVNKILIDPQLNQIIYAGLVDPSLK